MTRSLLIREMCAASGAQTGTCGLLIASAYANESQSFRLLLCQPMALSLPLWVTETSVRRRFVGSSQRAVARLYILTWRAEA
jgi:hypothetical protein